MKYFSLIIFIFSTTNVYALDFSIKPGVDDADGNHYYSLMVRNGNESKKIDVVLENNAASAEIKNKISVSCHWGDVEGVRIRMSSSSIDGMIITDELYFFNKNLDSLFAKGYTRFENTIWKKPLSLEHSICENLGGGVKKDSRLGRYYLEDNEVIYQGPFSLNGVSNVDIKYVLDKKLKLLREDGVGESVVETYEGRNNYSPNVNTVFFIREPLGGKIVSLISWGDINSEGGGVCYKVYSYLYNDAGFILKDIKVDNDPNLSMCESKGQEFKYKTASEIKKYLSTK